MPFLQASTSLMVRKWLNKISMKEIIYSAPTVEVINIQALSCLMGSDDPDPTNPNAFSTDFGAPKRVF